MKKLAMLVLVSAFVGSVGYAQAASCSVDAASKKLAGAAKTSFMKKCETDAQKACDAQAASRKLSGAAKTSFTKKCVNDAVGS
ncbi:MAG TPA: PsiF family protein [Pseudolabrys sp.]|nr:PsiF family protein [Pseudolabrys sp.]